MPKNADIYRIIGASNHTDDEREDKDFYATDPRAVDALCRQETFKGGIVEPCCGMGHISERLKRHGYKVTSYDIEGRGYGRVRDFFDFENMPTGCKNIITNPPYKGSTDFIIHALNLVPVGGKVAFFLKTQYLEGQDRYERVFKYARPKKIIQMINRVRCHKNGDDFISQSAIAYAWYVWEKGYKGKTIVEWEYCK